MLESDQGPGVDLKPYIEEVAQGQALTADDAERVFSAVVSGQASAVQVASILMGLRTRGVLPGEVAGGVRALRKVMVPVPAEDPASLTDTCGTGGGAVTTFNISTAAALVASGMGVRVAKHGNRSFTSRSGSADVLEALGVRIQLSPEGMGRVLAEVGIVFMFAPLLHPAMRHVGPIRKEMGITTIMNLLGPLTNPAGALRQMVGVAEPGILWLIVEALRELGHRRALVVHGSPGLDEMSPLGPTQVAELREDGAILEGMITPGQLGLGTYPAESLAGGTPEENARLVVRILEGREKGGSGSSPSQCSRRPLRERGRGFSTRGPEVGRGGLGFGGGPSETGRPQERLQLGGVALRGLSGPPDWLLECRSWAELWGGPELSGSRDREWERALLHRQRPSPSLYDPLAPQGTSSSSSASSRAFTKH